MLMIVHSDYMETKRIRQVFRLHYKSLKKLERQTCINTSCKECKMREVLNEHCSYCPYDYHVEAMNNLYRMIFTDFHETTFNERIEHMLPLAKMLPNYRLRKYKTRINEKLGW